jgi:type IV pilus assembly protein PilC
MAEFVVKMADERGRMLQQIETGHSASELRERFSLQGFFVYDVRPRSLLTPANLRLSGGKRIKLEQFVIFNSQFVTLIKAGLPILTALELLAKQQKNAYFKTVLEDVRQRVKSGEPLSQAFAEQNIASKIYTTTLLAGEKSGNLEEVLNRYIAFQRVSMTFRKKLLASLIYPALLVGMMFLLMSVLITWVVPQFAKLYDTLNAQLPAVTVFLLDLGKYTQKYILAILAIIAIVAVLIWNWQRSDTGARQLDKFRLSLPMFGGIWLKYQVAMFARMMATLLAGGLPLVPALETAGSSIESKMISTGVVSAAGSVREGRPLAGSLEETKMFPELSIEMIAVGESTGALPQMLTSVAEFYEEDVQTALAAALSLIEPFILIFMGIVVAGILLSLYLPIFNLGAAASAGH